ncbi:Acyl-CoA reductase (LuxC) [Muriicola jejuensis]|uniref:Acyl-CoA reductase n=1 Tax=Muriicola jejuensis TaxID=504488 RepID=A0A6P0UD63_9FLAO|nr:acyl-CoA reductase [Muriicola jejuensis]NER11195.1 acyl-CoA reductase [Muriicola jejuensis]SMP24213.1 Acyl-CoA reductase (LuxC) [Muriicola jejuensis]
MGSQEQRIQAFVKLGQLLRDFKFDSPSYNTQECEFRNAVQRAGSKNGWFTRENLEYAITAWGRELTEDKLRSWISAYSIPERDPRCVAVIMAGNIPMVGFHDLLCVLMTGHRALVKLSSGDTELLPALIRKLVEYEPLMEGIITVSDGIMKGFDAVIATGSDNTSRYFEYYFGNKPHIIRKNRNSVAVLTGKETPEQLKALGNDIFMYFGLGCRNVSKLFVPQGYSFESLFTSLEPFESIKNHHKYHNNYDYNKAVYLMSEFPFLDNGFLILKEDKGYASPIGTVYYETYSTLQELGGKLEAEKERIQCVVADGFSAGEVPFGRTQNPSLSDYADGVDTVEFLLKT